VSKLALIVNACLFIGILVAYTVLTALHDDGTALLGLLAGQALTVGASKIADGATNGTGTAKSG
jgi:hypothetical protein